MRNRLALTALLLVLVASPVAAQAPAPAPAPGTPPKPPAPPPSLVFEREVFEYQAGGRRDPFRPLTSNDTSGPLFSELTLTGIVFQTDASKSLATFTDLSKKNYRVRRGDRIGNATIQYIDKTRVVFSIEEFGMKRQEVITLGQERSQ